MLICLIGYRGTGKTTIAQWLALKLGWDWVDADVELELRAGKSIAEIFATDGETAFRDLESQELARLLVRDEFVLAAGGGVVLREENRRRLRELSERGGRVVWLQASPQIIQQRLADDATTASRRPNLTAAGGLEEIAQLLDQRRPWYQECADVEIDTEGKSPEEIVQKIVSEAMRHWEYPIPDKE